MQIKFLRIQFFSKISVLFEKPMLIVDDFLFFAPLLSGYSVSFCQVKL